MNVIPDSAHPLEHIAALTHRVRLGHAELAAALHLAYAQGVPLRSLAAASEMSHEQVRRIVQERQSRQRRNPAALSHFVTM